MADSILVVVEQRQGKLNRVSWETIAAGQAIAAETGWTLEAAVAADDPQEVRRLLPRFLFTDAQRHHVEGLIDRWERGHDG